MADPQQTPATPNDSARRSPSGADLVLLLLLILVGFGIWAVMERVVTDYILNPEPSEQRVMAAREINTKTAELNDLQNEASEFQKYINAAQLEQIKQHAAAEAVLAESFSNVRASETTRAYQEAKGQEQLANSVLAALQNRLSDLKTRADKVSSELSTSKETAETQLRRARFWYGLKKKGLTLGATLIIVFVLVLVVWAVLWKLARKRMSTTEGFRPFVFAFAALVVLFAYDQFSYAGAAFVSILLLLLWLRRINWPNKSDLLAK